MTNTVSDLIDKLNEVYNDIDNMTQVPSDQRSVISQKLEEIMDALDNWVDEYGNDPEDSDEDRDFNEDEDDDQ